MRRAIATLLVTAAVTVLLVNFKAQPALTSGTSATTRTSLAATKASGSSSAGGATRTVTGPSVSTAYGPVQVAVTVSGGRVRSVRAVTLPSGNPRSDEISSQAGPLLAQETVSAQSAAIDTVSGASYTSEGYRQSLQKALDGARA